jgi:TolA-binding protein
LIIRALALGVALALAAAPARAATDRPQPKEADLGAKRSTAPDASLGGSLEAKKPAKAEAGGPTLDFETFRKTVEFDISGKRREEIASLQKLIQLGGGNDAETPQWYFRLAELQWEEAQYFFFEANRRDDRIIQIGEASPAEVARLRAEKKDLLDQSRKLQDQAVALYRAIISRHPSYDRLDEVLFFLGENLTKRNRNDPEALKAYRALIQRFPKSRYVPDAWMAFGEYYFEKGNKLDRAQNLNKALEAYRKAAEFQESSVYGYALYKQAWVHYNLGNFAEALELFRGVIFFGEMPTSTIPADRKLALVKEARKDYVRTWSRVSGAEEAIPDFQRVGGKVGWWEMAKNLADIYYGDGKDRDAVVLYAKLIKERPLSFDGPFFQSRVVTCAGRMGRKDAAVAQARVFVKMLRDLEATPEAKDPKNARLLSDARRDAENTLRILAVQYHNEWKKTRDEPVAGFAASVYHDYLDVFPDDAPAYEMRFFHAELLYALGRFEEAGEEYEHVALADIAAAQAKPKPGEEPRKPGKLFGDALENAVFAYDMVVRRLDETEKVPAADPKKRIPMAPGRKKLADACGRYLEWQPKGDKWVEVAYKSAQLHYKHNEFAEATDLFTRIALDHAEHKLASYATNLVLDAYNLLGDWRNVNGWAKRFYANKALIEAHPELRDDLARVIEQSAFKVIEERERAKDYEAAADEYLAFAKEWPSSKLASTSVYNASVDAVRAHRLDRAMKIRETFLAQWPDDPLASQTLYDNAEAYEAVGDFAEAADRYERYFKEWRRSREPAAAHAKANGKGRAAAAAAPEHKPAWDEKKANDAIINAALFRAGLREWGRAEAASLAYLDAWPDGADAPRLFLGLADLHGKQGQTAKELKQLEDYQRKYAKDADEWLAIQHRIARLLDKQNNQVGARRAYETGLEYWRQHEKRVKDRGLAIVAEARYRALQKTFDDYDAIDFKVREKDVPYQLQRKQKKLKEVVAGYGEVVKLKQVEPAVCSLHRMGLAYDRFAQTFRDAPLPRAAKDDAEVAEAYKAGLQEQIDGLHAKAVEALELSVKAARDAGLRGGCAKESLAILARLEPEAWGPAQEVVPAIVAAAPAPTPAGYGLLADVVTGGAAPVARRAVAEPLPALLARPVARRPAGEPADPLEHTGAQGDPQRRAIDPDQPLPKKKKGSSADDEDLLP